MDRNILFEHNRKAYAAAVSMMEQTNRAAVIHPTGTGKSFLAFQLCADHPDKLVCWLSPSAYIFETQKEKWLSAGGTIYENICFLTYARLMRMEKEELAERNFDYIILDEFHRCGAAQWGAGVERLREIYKEAKVLGLSATNIRYLDNQRDMAWELFGGNIASELTLGAAIAQGILPAPKYVLSVYSYQKELKKYEERVRQCRNRALQDAAEKELEALRRALDKADGLTEVFARHMLPGAEKNDKDIEDMLPEEKRKNENTEITPGKYIVFCANYKHLNKMRELAKEWFAKVDAAPHIYTAYSDEPETAAEFEAFKKDQSRHLKLLYCIDMLNEGVHIDGLSGVILLRPTVSPTIYKQQVGRALATGRGKTPVIFDIVMNIENLCSVGTIEEELRQAVFASRINGRENEIVSEHFRVIDEIKDCRKLFSQLNETLTASWNAMYAMAKEYYERYGNLDIAATYVTPDGYSLGAWIATQRKVYMGRTAGYLDKEQIRRLETIGMCWQGRQEMAWEKNFAQAEKYFREYGDLEVPADFVTEDGCKLGRWVRRQRERYQKIIIASGKDKDCLMKLSEEKDSGVKNSKPIGAINEEDVHTRRMERLTQIGIIWESMDSWERRFALAKQYYEEHGNLRMAADYIVEGVWLSRWLREQRARLAKNIQERGGTEKKLRPLSEEQRQKLASIGIRAGVSQAELSWREQYGQAEEFYRRHGNLFVPKRYMAGNGKNLDVWLQHQRAGHRNGVLASWQVRLLDGIGMVWESGDPWEQGFAHAMEYFKANGHLKVPNQYVCTDGYRLGKWISNQRFLYGNSEGKKPGEEKIQRLNAIGMIWSARRGRCSEKKVQVKIV